ncbi:hypothetical protein PHYSODRAFT_307384 [Phytophthora sojae]|uniref:Uncharacterized protein n=1 Tax=Phytophthora sojae (strain P6497) TaxID=1094619 RepID=G5AE71_PHYSP|nr:hypothetical protein PHYSODRAFT_307384 [Phytophthora sojae]EGZ06473.1 hypothetical protein PHYSODRAFT_307384 [Phytophthora sojae]|eukprot:XP_009538370.1 hypothetical protein PHYSODRAFT_307384 [Phytophthora sojae]
MASCSKLGESSDISDEALPKRLRHCGITAMTSKVTAPDSAITCSSLLEAPKPKHGVVYLHFKLDALLDKDALDWMNSIGGRKNEELRGLPDDVCGSFSRLPMKVAVGALPYCGETLSKSSMNKETDATNSYHSYPQ